MDEILSGVRHWTAIHPNHGMEVGCHWVPAAAAVIDPLVPAEGLEAFRGDPPKVVLLSNRHHLRDGPRFKEEFGATIRCSELGLHEFGADVEVEGFAFGEEVAPGIEALEVGAICPDETALLIAQARALLVADGLMHYGGELRFVSDRLLGDDHEAVKRGLREAYSRLLDRDFDNLLFAHGDPLLGGANQALRAFCDA